MSGHRSQRSALITYGSETGNAQDVAEELTQIAERIHFFTRTCSLDEVELSTLSDYSIVLITVSTTGQGDLPLNARRSWKSLLRKKLPADYLAGVRFVVFGLGDSSYPKFNWAARKLQRRLLQLGAYEIYPQGEADERHPEGLDAAFVPWSTGLRQQLLNLYPLHKNISPIPDDVLLHPRWMLTLAEAVSSEGNSCEDVKSSVQDRDRFKEEDFLIKGLSSDRADLTTQNLHVTLEINKRITPDDHWQDVRHIVFRGQKPANYEPGDVIVVFPKNQEGDVDDLINSMQWAEVADKLVRFAPGRSRKESNPNPLAPIFQRPASGQQNMTFRTLLIDHLDLTAIPRRSFFSKIAQFSQDQTQRARLLEFAQLEFLDELYDYTSRPRRSILEVLQEFDSVKIPWQWAANVLPELRGRHFSIASGGQLKYGSGGEARFELLVAIVRYQTVIQKIREGVCTRYLSSLPVGTDLRVLLQKGSLGMVRKEASRPIVMVGPGTGVAPMRSLIWERLSLRQNHPQANGNNLPGGARGVGESVLFFGCRKRNSDFFFGDEWAELKSNMSLQVFVAFSREQKEKVYVQDVIKQRSELVFRLLHKDQGTVYVCGSSGKMPQGVRASLVEVFKQKGDMDQRAAEGYLQEMEKQGRYKQETW